MGDFIIKKYKKLIITTIITTLICLSLPWLYLKTTTEAYFNYYRIVMGKQPIDMHATYYKDGGTIIYRGDFYAIYNWNQYRGQDSLGRMTIKKGYELELLWFFNEKNLKNIRVVTYSQ